MRCTFFQVAVLSLLATALTVGQSSRNLEREKGGRNTAARTALVIGNGAYSDAMLKNPPNDAADMAAALRSLGFEVMSYTDLDQAAMKRAIRDFGAKLRSKGGTGLFYYAGHGVQVKGINYLIPVRSSVNTEEEVEYEAVEAGLVLAQMESARNDINIVILDACRNNPFARSYRSSDKGLASINAPSGTLIAYSTAPGSVASDGTGRNGIYTQELLKKMRTPGLGIEEVFKQVRISVRAATAEKQTPWESSSLTGEFYFAGQTDGPGGQKQVQTPPRQDEPPMTYRGIENSVGMLLRQIPAGEFVMGSPDSRETSPTRTVQIREFWLSAHEITIAQWKKVMGSLPAELLATSASLRSDDDQPVIFVSWNDASAFVDKLNSMDKNWTYRLPTEAEWEYAARAGSVTSYSVGSTLTEDLANFDPTGGVNAAASTRRVGSYAPNRFGLFDMHGNVAEWVQDIYSGNYSGLPSDGSANLTAGNRARRVFRGGAWNEDAPALQSHVRRSGGPVFRDARVGFRVAAQSRSGKEVDHPNSRASESGSGRMIVQESMFTFELIRCTRSGSMVMCEFTITNNDKIDKKLEVPFPDNTRGRTIDDQGGQSELDSWQIGSQSQREALLIPDVRVRAYFRFKGVSSESRILKRLDLGLETNFLEGGYLKRRDVIVRVENIPLQ